MPYNELLNITVRLSLREHEARMEAETKQCNKTDDVNSPARRIRVLLPVYICAYANMLICSTCAHMPHV